MRISKKAEYALRALVAMSRVRRSWTVPELARLERIPAKILEQVLSGLKRGGLVMSMRGVKGGYSFRRDPSSITVADVITALDGPIAPVSCVAPSLGEQCTCPDQRNCAVQAVMREARDRLLDVFGRYTVEDLGRLHPGQEMLTFEI